MTPMQAILMRTEQTIIRVISRKILKKILEQLSLKYGFNSLEALKRLNVEELLQKVCSLPKRMNDSADVSDDVSVKKRGRPCKVKGTRESSGDDLIASLIADVKMQNPTPALPLSSSKSSYLECDDYDDDDIEDEETIEVTRFQYGGIQYYKNTNNNDLYDINTNDVIGRWNEATKNIDSVF
jgi:hypothetical protein